VYSHAPLNFTLLSREQLDFGNPCYQYMHSLYILEQPGFDLTLHPIYKPIVRDDFVASAVQVLQKVKQLSVSNHNITITSAIISRPEWIGNEGSDMIDEACLLAGIEVFEKPSSNINMAVKTVEDQEPHNYVLIIQMNHLGLGVYRRYVTKDDGDGSKSLRLELDAYVLHELLADRVIQRRR